MILNVQFEELTKELAFEFGEINNISDGGYERGYAEGHSTGYTEGHVDGQAEGRIAGYTEGYDAANDYILGGAW